MNNRLYDVRINKSPASDLKKLDPHVQSMLREAIVSLASNPRPHGCRALQGAHKGTFRIRCGNYRVLYTVNDERGEVLVIHLGDRKDVYE